MWQTPALDFDYSANSFSGSFISAFAFSWFFGEFGFFPAGAFDAVGGWLAASVFAVAVV